MERRAILAALLMAGLLMVYQLVFVKPTPHQITTPPQEQKEEQAPPANQNQVKPVVPSAEEAVPPKEAPGVADHEATVETPLYRAVVSSDGGRFETWDLIYRGVKPMVVDGELGPLGLTISGGGKPARRIRLAIAPDSLKLGQGADQGEMKLVGEDGFGLRVTEVMRFHADSYVVEHDIKVENQHGVQRSAEIGLSWVAPVQWPKGQEPKFQGQYPVRAVKLAGGAARREQLAKLVNFRGAGEWIGLESEWYLNALVPTSKGFDLVEVKQAETRPGGEKPVEIVEVGVRAAITALEPGATWQGRILTYAGPKEWSRLKAVGHDLDKSIYFGGFPIPQAYGGLPMEWLAVPILWVMDLFYAYIGNYGVAIILLTVITKVLFFPLTIKSMTSMKAMQALQPQVNAIRAKYKSDPQRLQKETMELYREHKVNPLGGCLPMIVQIPIFYALYVALSVSVELQSQPFICFGRIFGVDVWICDLAAHDPTYVLPLLMGASMFIQQKMTPTMGDPRQAKMMLFMPVVFTFMFLNLPSGLVLYWTLSNVFQIAQQKYIEHISRKPQVGKLEKGPRVPKKA
jgi:YidC/Oxa1 family membrane protein insertase